MAYTTSDRDLPAHQARQQQVADGAELLVLLQQIPNLAEHHRGRFLEQSNVLAVGYYEWNELERVNDNRVKHRTPGVLLHMLDGLLKGAEEEMLW